MITPTKIFYKRIISEWKFQYGVWRTAIDWTVALYIVIPSIIFGVYQYIELWQTQLPWLSNLPPQLFTGVIFFFVWKGTVRIFIEEADQLFLWQQKSWLKQILKLSIGYSVFLKLCFNGFIFLLLAPVALGYQFSMAEFMQLFIISFLAGMCLNFVQQFFSLVYQGIIGVVAQAVLFFLAGILFVNIMPKTIGQTGLFTVIALLLSVTLGTLIFRRLTIKGTFFKDVTREQYARLRHLNFLLGFTDLNIKRPLLKRKHPTLFSSSNPLFKKRHAANCLAELGIKFVVRDIKNIWQYLQMVLVLILIVFTFPEEWMWILWVAFAALLTFFVRSYWQEFISSEFINLFPRNDKIKIAAAKKFMFIMTLPGFMMISFIAGFVTFSWLGAICGMLAGVVIVLYFSFRFNKTLLR
ncbi:ABC transporter permease [Desulfoscipio gibsoniae]|uniref:Putative ABC-type exoprotein transport system, permease component n=1 Tax=Desulfoscipio gibsoniae DSM 7213 TaxID=767817 RepID=R4KLY9_9FIRM|nr:ABC transporter permease [Desulfoscipio gibsoniae]AGL02562.1 putative ABC-type exoprotein transport system, permease component [Desulfoscipio gibsoniae DSM 7213]